MNPTQAFILGAIQGLSEFLPISSSGHLLIAEKLMGLAADNRDLLSMNILLHLGTLAAVVLVYWQRVFHMLLHPVRSELRWLAIATLPAVAAALLFDFDPAFEGRFIAWSFLLTSLVLLAGEWIHARRRNHSAHEEVCLRDALGMGVMQAVAILPGLSRSGSTIAGGVASGLTRERAADFSFLMSIPAILGSAVFDIKDTLGGSAPGMPDIGIVLVGVAAAMAFGLIAIQGFLSLIRRISMKWFALYTALLGAFLLVNQLFLHWLPFV